jgi:glycosyltransferase involved in cell wall biosynthesis
LLNQGESPIFTSLITEFMKKVLFITFYWPPSGGSGVQRGLYFAKYLRRFGWEPIVYTPQNPEYPALDHSLISEIPKDLTVLKTPIWEPYSIYKYITGQKPTDKIKPLVVTEEKTKRNWAHQLSVAIRGNFFIPDARIFWVKPSVKFLQDYLEKNPVDAIFSTSPPQSLHLIAKKVNETTGIPWIADFRDPWTRISYFEELRLTSRARKKHERLEQSVLKSADKVITVSPALQSEFEALSQRSVSVITNGFDPPKNPPKSKPDPNQFTLSYIGTLSRDRNPQMLWKTLNVILKENPSFANHFRLSMIGPIDDSVFTSINDNELEGYLERTDYIPHDEVPEHLAASHALLLIGIPGGRGVLTGKLFEYLNAQRFILSIGPTDGDIVPILNKTNAGTNADFNDPEAIKKALQILVDRFEHQIDTELPRQNVDGFSRENLTSQLANHLNEIT